MANKYGSTRNWGVAIAVAVAVPLILLWTLVTVVGGALVCEGIDGPCGGGAAGYFGGVAIIFLGACALGYAINLIRGALRRG